ncbi:protease complex subunit PrcB family protein [Flavobacterium sp. GT3R68]|uniref:protease complex subunit PrcB family protein n=1 Tax=Flavobacterium sp. GT3R68 TaxID=2594437 RepID=UPI000F892253|nr:protease complex subunit PrcB family protein [Flavobacterium sp. GT3R68]RTY93621.1 protease complex subunit PrcB family protein [Flavobacterium sp. GSN2]TRW91658.1 protease complex subunit PrcB family protein [Flavobacterium sp. GT3R68]
MKKVAFLFLALAVLSCGAKKTTGKKPLFQVLTQQNDGGGNIHFFEIVSDKREFTMLLNDDNLKRKIKPDDINTSNFIILNMGAKTGKGYSIEVVDVQETADKIIITVKENEPEGKSDPLGEYTYPYSIVKINSKKEIIIK